VRDLPAALVDAGWQVTVATPAYGIFHEPLGAKNLGTVDIEFRGMTTAVDIYDVPGSEPHVRNIVFEHANMSPQGRGRVYCSDDPERPFATDANKFAFFCTAAAVWIDQLEELPDVVHLHDWHAAFYCLLREYGQHFERLRRTRTVFTIHNLSYQGIRPISGDESALESWFPNLRYTHSAIRDPAYADCFNPMATAIRLADKVSTVSPTYANEICAPSNHDLGFIGGEGLEHELEDARQNGRLTGILNGCRYNGSIGRRPGWQRLLSLASDQVATWRSANRSARAHKVAIDTLQALPKRRPKHVLTSIGRLVRQKVSLFLEELPDGRPAIECVLDNLGSHGVVIILGSGEANYERRMIEIAERARNLLFLCGYSDTLAEPLYRAGDLFLMPSSFEPCGISQMLAMRATQPCVVHGVGGLRDTVQNNRSGFVFAGRTPQQQAKNFVATVERALTVKTDKNDEWQKICIHAASARFSWRRSAQQTIEQLYEAA
jgi:starch synthase